MTTFLLGGLSNSELEKYLNSKKEQPLAFSTFDIMPPSSLEELGRLSIDDGVPLCEPLSYDVERQSHFDLLRTLQEQGWQWQRLSSKQKTQLKAVPYERGGAKLLRSAGVTLSLACLRCLVRCDADGHPRVVPHGQPDSVYKALCAGESWEELRQKLLQKLDPRRLASDPCAGMERVKMRG